MTKFVNQPFLAVAAGVAAVTLSGIASAQTSGSSYSTSSSGVSVHDTVATQLISVTTLQQMLTISNAITARSGAFQGPTGPRADAGQRFGMAAGNATEKWNVWGAISGDNTRYDGGTIPTRFSADATNTVLGADYTLTPTLALGLSTAFDNVTGSSTVGAGAAAAKYRIDGYTIAPYLGWQINQDWSLDATMGWGQGSYSGSSTANPDRFFYGSNLNYTRWFGNWQVTGKGSYLHGEEKFSAASTNEIGQWRLGAQAGYWMNGVMPYLGLSYSTDNRSTTNAAGAASTTDDLGKNALLWSVGANFISLKNSLTGGIAYSAESGRDHSKHDTLMANINYRF